MPLQPGVFNVTDPTYGFPVLTTNLPLTNTINLQNWVDLLLSSGGPTNGQGGTLQFPSQGTYKFSGAITVGTFGAVPKTYPYTIIFMGTGQGSQSAPILEQQGNSDLFVIETNDGSDADIGGTTFQDLMMSFTGSDSLPGTYSAVHIMNKSQSVRLYRCTLINWPVAAYFQHSYRATMIDCTVHVIDGVSYATIGLQLGASNSGDEALETYVSGSLFLDASNLGTGVQIYGMEHVRVVDTRIEGWMQGIAITPNAASGNPKKLYFANVSCYPSSMSTTEGAALLIQTSGSSADPCYVVDATFAQCQFEPPQPGGTSYTGGGVVIEPGGPDDVIDQVRFVDCHVCLWNGPGLYVVGPSTTSSAMLTNVEVLGGYYSCNGLESVPHKTGIALIGVVSGVRVTGAACNNSLYNVDLTHPVYVLPTQNYGIEVTGGAASVRINACDLTGNLQNGAYIDGTTAAPSDIFVMDCHFTKTASLGVVTPVTNLQVRGCPGYNDQGTVIATSFPALGSAFTIAQLGSPPYFGPGECYVDTAGANVKVNDQDTHLTSGSFYLEPLETIEIDTGVAHFVAIGK